MLSLQRKEEVFISIACVNEEDSNTAKERERIEKGRGVYSVKLIKQTLSDWTSDWAGQGPQTAQI